MNITSKSRYAIKILMDLAEQNPLIPSQRAGISTRQDIPSDYMDQIFIRLRKAGLVRSRLGRSGGYQLAREPSLITVWDIFEAAEGCLTPVRCLSEDDNCTLIADCVAKGAWKLIYASIKESLQKLRLLDVLDQSRQKIGTEMVGEAW